MTHFHLDRHDFPPKLDKNMTLPYGVNLLFSRTFNSIE